MKSGSRGVHPVATRPAIAASVAMVAVIVLGACAADAGSDAGAAPGSDGTTGAGAASAAGSMASRAGWSGSLPSSAGLDLIDESARQVQSGAAQLFVREFGEGDPLLVIHGGPGMEHSYLVPGLDVLQNDARLVFYDQRGTGRSVVDLVPEQITMDAFIADVDAVRAAAGVESIDVLAHSFGGLLGVLYATRHPDRVRSLILVNSVDAGNRFAQETAARQAERRDPAIVAELDRLTRSEAFASRDTTVVSRVYWTGLSATFADVERADRMRMEFTRQTADNGGPVASFLVSPISPYDFWPDVARIASPTLVVHGVEDVLPQAVAEAYAGEVPAGELALISDAGHMPFIEQPDAFQAAVSAFLARVREGTSR